MGLLDIRTIIFSFVLTNIVSTLVIIFLWNQYHKRYEGIPYLIFAFAFQTLAFILISLREAVPLWLSIDIANAISVTGILLGYKGLEAYSGKRSSYIPNIILMLVTAAVYAWVTYFNHNLTIRYLLISAVSLALFAQCAWLLLYRVQRKMKPFTNSTGLVFLAFCLVCVAKIVEFFVNAKKPVDYFQSDMFEAITMTLYQMLLVVLTYSLALMFSKHLLSDIEFEEEKFSTAFHTSTNAIVITRFPSGQIVEVNYGFQDTSGYQYSEISGKTIAEIKLWDREEDRKAILEELSITEKIREKECRVRKKSGELIIGLLSAEVITVSDEKYLLSTFKDITEQKNYAAVIQDERNLLRTLIDNLPDPVSIKDFEGRYIINNRAHMRMIGVDCQEEVLGKTAFDFFPENDAKAYDEDDRKVMISGGKILDIVENVQHSETGKSYWHLTSKIPFPDSTGKSSRILTISHDITELKKAEEELILARDKAEESDRLKTSFLHNISHEIRTPLNAIVGFSTLLGEPVHSDETRQSFIEVIKNSSDNLLAVVNDIIEVSNIEAGILKYKMSEINLNAVLENLYKQFRTKADQKGIKFRYETTLSDPNAYIQTDSTKLIEILLNLISNAFKFTSQGFIEFGYKLKNNYLEFYVSDSGVGIPEDQQNKIFERFYQVDNTITSLYEGTGLGLSISKGFIEFLGGEIRLTSEKGKGTDFYFTLPYVPFKPSDLNLEKPCENRKVFTNDKKSVLIAEDDENNYFLMVKFLSSLNVNIIRAINGEKTVEICRSGKDIDLVLMDIKMPVIDGYTALKRIRNILPSLPVIATTAYAFESDMERILNSGFDDYLSKPFSKKALLNIVRKHLNRKIRTEVPEKL